MGNKNPTKNTESSNEQFKISVTRTISRGLSLSGGQDDKRYVETQKKYNKEKQEKELCDLVAREKDKIFQSSNKNKAKVKMNATAKRSGWEELQSGKLNEGTTVLDLSNCDLSNSKVFERFCSNIADCKRLVELNLSDCSLQSFPKNLPSSLKTLLLRQNMIRSIELPLPEKLQVLDLSYNRISQIPKDLNGKITDLDLHNNSIESISHDCFTQMDTLHNLNLAGNQLKKVEFSLQSFTNLYTINLSFNKIAVIPGNFYQKSNPIRNLIFSNNPLSELHPRVGIMENIVKIDLRSTKITTLPSTLVRLKNLEHLFLDRLVLTFPPMYIVRKGLDEIMKYLKENPQKNEERMKESDDEEEKKEESKVVEAPKPDQKYTPGFGTFLSALSSKNNTLEKTVLKKGMFKSSKDWIEFNLYTEDDQPLKTFLTEMLDDRDVDLDKSLLTLNSIKSILQNYIKEYDAGSHKIEIPASSSYFIGRIGGYPKALMFFSTINFQLESKPYAGLYFSITATQKTYVTASNYLKFLQDFISVLKECRINEQFLPDYDLS